MDNNHGAQISQLSLPVEFFLDMGVSHKDKRADSKVVVSNNSGKMLRKLHGGDFLGTEYTVSHITEILQTLEKLHRTVRKKSLGQSGKIEGGQKEVASTISNGKTASTPWATKKGE